jgi:nitroreductase
MSPVNRSGLLRETSITKTIQRRFSCRHYENQPIPEDQREELRAFIQSLPPGPFGSQIRFDLIAATGEDRKALQGLGTYGFIKNAPAFVIGASVPSNRHLEDFGYLLESIILYATSLGLGTCWLGGTFTKSRFAKKIEMRQDELIPAVAATGKIANPHKKRKGLVSLVAGAHKRLPWQDLFYNSTVGVPLLPNEAGEYTTPLEMLRLSPSASNKQPWRIIFNNQAWRFYLHRTPGYRDDPIKRVLSLCDLQRVDMGIAMCHFEWTAHALGLPGKWKVEESLTQYPHPLGEYVVSWLMQTETN